MSVNARGLIVLGTSLAVLAVTSALVFWPSHPHAPQPATPPSAPSKAIPLSSKEHAAACDNLAEHYRSVWLSSTACDMDADCIAEPRGGVYTALDGCARFGNPHVSHAAADALAAQWLKDACAWAMMAYVDCGAVRVQCLAKRCVELPPEPVPKDWQRMSLPGVVSVFAPADFIETDERGIDSDVRVFSGRHRTLELSVDPYGPAARDAGALVVIDGHRARVESSQGARYTAHVTFEEGWDTPLQKHAELSLRMTCSDEPACADAQTIIHSMRFMTKSFDTPMH